MEQSKGQEGIQIIDEGGMLYDAENRMSDRTIASLSEKCLTERKCL